MIADTATPARTIYMVRQLQLAIYARLEEALRAHQLTPIQYTVLSILCRRQGLSSAELSRRFSVTPQSMNELVAVLERKGLIRRQEAPENRRVLRVSPTAEGKRLLARCDRLVDELESALFAGVGRGEMVNLRQTLAKVLATARAPHLTPALSAPEGRRGRDPRKREGEVGGGRSSRA
jgi:DNA-binding MarR family transcriptional regulator